MLGGRGIWIDRAVLLVHLAHRPRRQALVLLVSIVTGGLIAGRSFWGSISIVGNAGAGGIRFKPELAVTCVVSDVSR
jgi:hypothetical protein